MPKVFLHTKIRATWKGHSLSAEPSSAQEVAGIAIRLLIEELGSEKARRFMRRELARYRRDYKGAGRDDRGPVG